MHRDSQQDENSPESKDSGDNLGKVLPFRRPSPEPTLNRRTGGSLAKNLQTKAVNKQKIGSKPWKGKFAQILQVVLLATAFALALKNCGKI